MHVAVFASSDCRMVRPLRIGVGPGYTGVVQGVLEMVMYSVGWSSIPVWPSVPPPRLEGTEPAFAQSCSRTLSS